MCLIKSKRNRGVSTVFGTVLFTVLIVTLASALFIALYRYNDSVNESNSVDRIRAQEKIVLTNLTLVNGNVTGIAVDNIGSVTSQIKAFYVNDTFVCDPSDPLLNPDLAYINAQGSQTINVKPVVYNPSDYITVATARGIRTIEFESTLVRGPSSNFTSVDTNYGPLRLNFNLFYYKNTDKSGFPTGSWQSGANVSTSTVYCAWNITVTNIDTRDITLNQYSSLTLVSNAGGAQFPWYINNTSLFIASNKTVNIIYIWTNPLPCTTAQSFNGFSSNVGKVFLTFYGNFSDGATYGQTIPFEAVVISGDRSGYVTDTILNPITNPLAAGATISFNGQVTVTSPDPNVPSAQQVILQYRPSGSQIWANLSTGTTYGNNGLFSGTFKAPHPGTYEFQAYFIGASKPTGKWAMSISTIQIVTTKQATSTTAISISPATVSLGQSITATATVTPSYATGSVTFQISTDNGITFNPLGSAKTLVGGRATSDAYTPSTIGSNYRINATYDGDIDVTGSTSPWFVLTVNIANPTISIPTLTPASPIILGDSFTATVTVNGVLGIAPTGTITFRISSDSGLTWSTIGTKTLTGSVLTSNSYIPTAGGNQYRIIADYSGDLNYGATSSGQASLTVNARTPDIGTPTFAPVSPITYGTPVTVSITITGNYGTPTGSVDFQTSIDGGTTFTKIGATKTLSLGTATSDPYLTPSVGNNYLFRAVYAGDNNYLGITSPNAALTVTQASTSLTVVCNPTTINKTGSIYTIISGTISPNMADKTINLYYQPGAAAPDTGAPTGGSWTLIGSIITLSDGSYTYNWDPDDTLADGYYWINTEFAGDASYLPCSATTGTIVSNNLQIYT